MIEDYQVLASATDFENHIYIKIYKIEQTSNHLVSGYLMLEIMNFFEDLAKIIFTSILRDKLSYKFNP